MIRYFPNNQNINSLGVGTPADGVAGHIKASNLILGGVDLSAPSGSSLVGFQQTGIGTVATTVQSELLQIVNALRFSGIDPTGVTDSLAGFNAAHTALALTGKSLFVPAGNYNLTGTMLAKVPMYGEGRNTQFVTYSSTLDVIAVQSPYVKFKDFAITTSPAKTGGYYINTNGQSDFTCESTYMFNPYMGIGVTGAAATRLTFENLKILGIAANGVGIAINSTGANTGVLLRDIWMQALSILTQPSAGIQVVTVGDLLIENVITNNCGTGLLIAPTAGKTIQDVYVDNCDFDSGSGSGINIIAIGAGANVQSVRINNTWSCTNAQSGIIAQTSTSGVVTSVSVMNCILSNNTGYGMLLNDSGVTNTSVGAGTSMSANSIAGFITGANVTRYSVKNCILGACGQFAGNQYGIALANGNDNFQITDNDLSNNLTLPMYNPTGTTFPGTPGQTFTIARNLGLVTRSASSLTLAAAATANSISHGLAATPRIQDIIAIPNSGWGTSGNWYISAPTSTVFNLGTTANPGAGVGFSWQATLWGG